LAGKAGFPKVGRSWGLANCQLIMRQVFIVCFQRINLYHFGRLSLALPNQEFTHIEKIDFSFVMLTFISLIVFSFSFRVLSRSSEMCK
jgi:hypothetical protein